jgi:hypothetical protein
MMQGGFGARSLGVKRVALAALAGWLCLSSAALALDAPSTSDDAAPTTCRNVAVPIKVGGQSGSIAGTLCTPPGATAVELLISGWTYNRGYFDLGYQPDTYSYARAANRDGYATLAIDRLGAGASLHPLSLFDTLEADVRTTHDVVRALRNGAFGTRYTTVVEVGHSLGSIDASYEAGIYHDVNAIITTGFSHGFNYPNSYIEIAGHDEPAFGAPEFAGLGLDPLYLTSDPGTRQLFTYGPNTDPAVNAYDEAHLRSTDTLVEGVTIGGYPLDGVDRNLNIPVFDVIGDRDPFFCGLNAGDCTTSAAMAAFEKPFYGAGATVQALVLPNTGHDLTLERTSPQATAAMLAFSEQFAGAGRGATNTTPGVRPAPVITPAGTPPLVAQLADLAFVSAAAPGANAYTAAVQSIPGLGSGVDPNPFAAQGLSTIANLVNQFSGNVPQELLGG